ncbi:MAG TPA: hypothetical protein VJ954_02920 [Ignavibacteriaceae bacterium]|nr:hypothetical protein [Ignavibacteriaceae bacterium]
MKFNNKVIVFTVTASLIMLAAFSLGFNPAPAPERSNTPVEKKDTTVKIKKYYFSTWENGEKVHWKAVLRNREIQNLFKNDDKLSGNEIDKYKDMVFDRIHESHFDFDSFDADIPDIDIHFDSEKFNRQMERMKENLKNMKMRKFDFQFDKEKFSKQMKKMRENLKEFKDCDFFDDDAFEKSMEQVSKNLADLPINIHVDIDADAIAKSMENVRIHMKDIKIDMSNLREKMKQLKGFLKGMRSELVKDGYLDDEDEDFEMEFTRDKLEINGKRLPDNLFEKYKEMYKEHFGKEISNKFRINN